MNPGYYRESETEPRPERTPRFLALRAFMKMLSDFEDAKIGHAELYAEGVRVLAAYADARRGR